MKRPLAVAAAALCAALFGLELHAAPNWIITPLARKTAANGCTQHTPGAKTGGGYHYVDSGGPNTAFYCAVDTVTVPPSQITRAVAYVKLRSLPQPAWARLCFRSLKTGHEKCGALAYGTQTSTSITSLVALAPKGGFDDTYAAYVMVLIPRPYEESNELHGYELQKVTVKRL